MSEVTLAQMTEVIRHRGPDDVGSMIAPGVAIGVRRLSIVDVEAGHQPFPNEDETVWAAQNGELYEHERLREQLTSRGHSFTSRCDTEVIPHLYEEHGADFPKHLRGMFSIAVWDGRARRLILARDRLGIKPLYYSVQRDRLVFGSELKSVLASGLVPAQLDYRAIDAYLTLGYFPAPLTPLLGVAKLLPGHTLIADESGVRESAYWSYPRPSPVRGVPAEEHAERLLAKLDESVRLRLMSDVPLGAMLSGGLDSSVIVALMARHMSEPVKTFAVGFSGAGERNELADARLVSAHLGTEHHELNLPADHPFDLERLCWHMDEPLADLSALGFYELSELASQHVTVALSGQGADELLAGYRKHRAAAISGAFGRATLGVGTRLARLVSARSDGRAIAALAAGNPAERMLASASLLTPDERRCLVRGPLAELDGTAESIVTDTLGGVRADALSAALYLDARLALPDDMLHYFDRASMAHSLEVRVPFLDHEVVELCATIPSNVKLRRLGRTKHVLKLAARGLIPEEIIDKPKVGFFNRSVEGWLRTQTNRAIADYLLDHEARVYEFIDRSAVETLVRTHSHERGTHLLLSLLMLEVWLSTYLPRATRSYSLA